jgi:hypothetical protein
MMMFVAAVVMYTGKIVTRICLIVPLKVAKLRCLDTIVTSKFGYEEIKNRLRIRVVLVTVQFSSDHLVSSSSV